LNTFQTAGASTLTAAINTNAATFKAQLVAKGGYLASVSGSTTTDAPAAGTVVSSSASTVTTSGMAVAIAALAARQVMYMC